MFSRVSAMSSTIKIPIFAINLLTNNYQLISGPTSPPRRCATQLDYGQFPPEQRKVPSGRGMKEGAASLGNVGALSLRSAGSKPYANCVGTEIRKRCMVY